MKVVAFNGSPRPEGNTTLLIRHVFEELEQEGVETEMVRICGEKLRGCAACYRCWETKDGACALKDDPVNGWIATMREADGIILASPTYFADATTEMKALVDRGGMATRAGGNLLARKVGAAVVAVRRAGAIHVFDTLNHFFLINEMVVPGSNYWNIGIGREPGEVGNDEEGLRTMHVLGKNMAWLLKRIHGGEQP